jgi:hypothetical protein
MRKHAQDKYEVVQVDSTFYEDEERKKYFIKITSPEYYGMQNLLREDGSSWLPEEKE